MRKRSLDMVFALMAKDERVAFLGSDLSPAVMKQMRGADPARCFMEGISEQNIIGMAAGMALEGYTPYVNTIASFITRRCFEQVAVDLCLHNLPVRLIGNGGGFVYAPLGPTHVAIEDIAIMRALPNMTVVAVCDAEEMARLMEATLDWPGPIYIRLAKGGDPVVSSPERGFRLGEAIVMREAAGADRIALIATGVMTTRALQAAEVLAAGGVECDVVHVHTIKPLDKETIVARARDAKLVVTVEEHSLIGGLGSAVLDCLNAAAPGAVPALRMLGVADQFVEHYGGQDDLMRLYGLQPDQIASSVRAALAGAMAA